MTNTNHIVNFILIDDEAMIPTRAYDSDIGYDLTATKVWKKIGEKTTVYDTGIAIQPPPGYYTEIIPRSSISKSGYILSNSIGIIDPDYTGSLKIAVTRIDESLPELTCPFTRFQLILRKAEHFSLQQVQFFKTTDRGSGGFGSTDNKV
jgi:dUTP pyrophosphatase